MNAFLSPLIQGFLIGAGLIISIGAQNAFVLKQGLKKNHVFATALFCSIADAFLIIIGAAGLGELISKNQTLLLIAKWGGATFLFWYGLRAFRAMLQPESLETSQAHERSSHSLQRCLLTLAALTFLNPHVYLDTVLLLGTIAAQFELGQRTFFAMGAIIASFCWFFCLCYGARLLAPLLKSHRSWKVIDLLTGCIMWAIALSLIFSHKLSSGG
jgi:L-lysine exporter family protein LysE/ArgO